MIKYIIEKYKKLYNMANEYAVERLIWSKAGRPYRTTERMLEIYNICASCEHFNNNSCGICGCNLHPTEKILPNKIAWATTECPLEEPKWRADYDGNLEISEEEIKEGVKPEQQMQSSGFVVPVTHNTQQKDCGCGKKRK